MDEQSLPQKKDTPSSAETEALREKYKFKKAQSIDYKEYIALQQKKKKRRRFSLPTHIKFILGTPLIILFGYGLVFIPWMLYVILTSPSAPDPEEKDSVKMSASADREEQSSKQ